ncbi:hypothetical protein, partial [Mycoplasmoides alvi]|uniref:hypothetical protein n=1 Tax=Mycoplasmoides alvi TaxID=78580 RepID=UPI001B80E39A
RERERSKFKLISLMPILLVPAISLPILATSCSDNNQINNTNNNNNDDNSNTNSQPIKLGDKVEILLNNNKNVYGPVTEILDNGLKVASNFYLNSDIQTIKLFSFKIGEKIQIASGTTYPNHFGMLTHITEEGLKLNNYDTTYSWNSLSLVSLLPFKLNDYVIVKQGGGYYTFYGCITTMNTDGITLSLNNQEQRISWESIDQVKSLEKLSINDFVKVTYKNIYTHCYGYIAELYWSYITIQIKQTDGSYYKESIAFDSIINIEKTTEHNN